MQLDFSQIYDSVPYILNGIVVTFEFTILSVLGGFIWGTVLSLAKISHIRILEWLATIYTSIFRGTPLILQLSIIYFATPQLIDYTISPLEAGVLAFALNSAAYIERNEKVCAQLWLKKERECDLVLS